MSNTTHTHGHTHRAHTGHTHTCQLGRALYQSCCRVPSCVPGGYYLTSLSASLALLGSLGQTRALPRSPSQELQHALQLWEQRRLPATHSLQVTATAA